MGSRLELLPVYQLSDSYGQDISSTAVINHWIFHKSKNAESPHSSASPTGPSAGKLVIRFHIDFPQSIPPSAGNDLEAVTFFPRGMCTEPCRLMSQKTSFYKGNHPLLWPNYSGWWVESTHPEAMENLKIKVQNRSPSMTWRKRIKTHLLRSPNIF